MPFTVDELLTELRHLAERIAGRKLTDEEWARVCSEMAR